MALQTFWFIVLAILWTGFFVLEGFDFGVGMIHGFVARNEAETRLAINAIGPTWDGNEVWLIVAGAGTFAAFPDWYATMFSGFYLALVLVLFALIIRGVSFEFRGKRESPGWRRGWDWLMTLGSLLAPLLIGCALANLVHGTPINAQHEYTGDLFTLLNPYSLFTGLTVTVLCVVLGATFLTLKTDGDLQARSRVLAQRACLVAAAVVVVFVVWTQVILGRVIPSPVPVVAIVAILAALWLLLEHRVGWAFLLSCVAMAGVIVTLFVSLYPRVMVSSTSTAFSLTVRNASSSAYTLKVMTVVALVFLPLVLIYQGWTYYVFRRRLTGGARGTGASGSPGSGPAGAPAAGD